MRAQNFNFDTKFPKNEGFQLQINKTFLTRKRFSDNFPTAQNFWQGGNCPSSPLMFGRGNGERVADHQEICLKAMLSLRMSTSENRSSLSIV